MVKWLLYALGFFPILENVELRRMEEKCMHHIHHLRILFIEFLSWILVACDV